MDLASILVSRMLGCEKHFFIFLGPIFLFQHPSQHPTKHPGSILMLRRIQRFLASSALTLHELASWRRSQHPGSTLLVGDASQHHCPCDLKASASILGSILLFCRRPVEFSVKSRIFQKRPQHPNGKTTTRMLHPSPQSEACLLCKAVGKEARAHAFSKSV